MKETFFHFNHFCSYEGFCFTSSRVHVSYLKINKVKYNRFPYLCLLSLFRILFATTSLFESLFCRYRGFILFLTFLFYTAYHLSRKPISIVKVTGTVQFLFIYSFYTFCKCGLVGQIPSGVQLRHIFTSVEEQTTDKQT